MPPLPGSQAEPSPLPLPGPEIRMLFKVHFRRHRYLTVCSTFSVLEVLVSGTGLGTMAYGEILGVFFSVDGIESEDLRK